LAAQPLDFIPIVDKYNIILYGKCVAQLDKYKFIGELSLLGQMVKKKETGASPDVVVHSDNFYRKIGRHWQPTSNYELAAKLLGHGIVNNADGKKK
jgi:hypothetical protein